MYACGNVVSFDFHVNRAGLVCHYIGPSITEEMCFSWMSWNIHTHTHTSQFVYVYSTLVVYECCICGVVHATLMNTKNACEEGWSRHYIDQSIAEKICLS